jgi:hypothetical protein
MAAQQRRPTLLDLGKKRLDNGSQSAQFQNSEIS